MSKTPPSKSKMAKKKAAPAKSGSASQKTASRPAAKKIVAKAAAKKAAPAKAKSAPPAKKTVPTKKTAPAKKATGATKSLPSKAAPAKKTSPAKKGVPAKRVVGKKTVQGQKAPVAKKATPAKKVPAAKPPVKKVAVKAPVKSAAQAKKTVSKAVVANPAPTLAPPPEVKAAPVSSPAPAPSKSKAKSGKDKGVPPVAPEAVLPPPQRPVMSEEKPVADKSGALFYDSHMHTPLCKHAWGEPEEYAAQALKSGLKGIIFTCHCPMPDGFWPSVRMSNSEFDTYVEIVRRAADAYAGRLDVCLGLESEFFPGHEKWIADLHKRADFDYILGAVHWQSKDYLTKFETGTIENFRRIYFEHLAQSAETGLYDCLAHPDLVKNYHPDSWCFAIIKDTVSGVLDRIAKTGVAMELNTSGLNKSYSEMNPGNEMLRMMAERGIPVVLGSDSHKAMRVGEHFITALNNLAEAGYENVSYFKKRQRIDLKISDVLASIRKAIDANAD